MDPKPKFKPGVYQQYKGFTVRKPPKMDRQKFLTQDDVGRILAEVQRQQKEAWKRDHGLIYLGFQLGLRVGEAVILERDGFRNLGDEIYVRTLKRVPRIPMRCKCGRRWRVAARRVGGKAACPACSKLLAVEGDGREIDLNPPEIQVPVIEPETERYVQNYMVKVMRPDQRWFFEGRYGCHLGATHASKIFSYYAGCAGLDPYFSFHALRHGRGVQIWELFEDPVMVRDMLRQKTLSAAEWYLHLSPKRKEALREKLSQLPTLDTSDLY